MKIKINLNEILMLLLIIPFISLPDYIVGTTFNNIMSMCKIFSFTIIFILSIKNNKISMLTIFFGIFQGVLFISTFLNNNADRLWDQFIHTISCLTIIMYSDYYINKSPQSFFKVVGKYICFLATINAISMIIYYPKGMYTDIRNDHNYYFLNLDNISFFTVYIGLICLIIYSIIKNKKIDLKTYLFLIFQFISYFYVSSTTAYILIATLIIFSILFNNRKKINLNFNYCIIALVIFTLCISVFKIQNSFEDILIMFLGRNATLTGRTLIWDRAFNYIKLSPIIGYGVELPSVLIQKVGFNHLHNIFIENLYRGGIIGTSIYGYIIFLISKKMKEIKKEKIYSILTFFFLLFLIMCQFDYYNYISICFVIYSILYNCKKISEAIMEVQYEQ